MFEKFLFPAFLAAAIMVSAAPAQVNTTTVPPANGQPTTVQREWLEASPEQRIRISEKLGEKGARLMASSKGCQPILDGLERI